MRSERHGALRTRLIRSEIRGNRENREFRECREYRTIRTIRTMGTIGTLGPLRWLRTNFLMVLSVLIFPIIPRILPQLAPLNLLLEGVRLGLSQKKTPRDSTLTYSPRGLTFSDGPRMAPYHNKLSFGFVSSTIRPSCHLLELILNKVLADWCKVIGEH